MKRTQRDHVRSSAPYTNVVHAKLCKLVPRQYCASSPLNEVASVRWTEYLYYGCVERRPTRCESTRVLVVLVVVLGVKVLLYAAVDEKYHNRRAMCCAANDSTTKATTTTCYSSVALLLRRCDVSGCV